jgi:hypothetical protein
MTRAVVKLIGNEFSLRELCAEGAAVFSGSLGEAFLIYVKIECKKGMSFEAVMPISNKYLISSTSDYKLPTLGPIEFSVKPPVIKSNPSFTS